MSKYDNLTPKEASGLIAEQLKIAQRAVSEAEAIADASGQSFSMDLGGYGMGGWYTPVPKKPEDAGDDWEASDESYGWQSSSSSC
jgi:hypothetical protein